MKAAFLTGIREVEIREMPEPQLVRPSDVLLEIELVGVCGSDMHYYRTGRIGRQVVQFPWVVGHECAATVLAAGGEVTNVKVGDRVALDPLIACGRCDQCLGGRAHTCRNQRFLGCPGELPGCLAQRLVMPARCCFPVGPEVTDEQAVLVEPFSIGLYAQRLAGDLDGYTVGILGSGPIGLCVLAAARAAGAKKIYSTDIRDYRANLAARFGADWTGNPQREDIVEALAGLEPLGLDFVYECAGEQETLDEAVRLLKPGGVLFLVGIPELDRVSFTMDLLRRKEIRIANVRRQNRCVEPAIRMLAGRRVDPGGLVTHTFSLDETKQAFDTVADYRDGVVKAMIRI